MSDTGTHVHADLRQTLLRRLDEVRSEVIAGGEDAARRRTLSPQTVDALTSAGLLAIKVPACLGGAEADPLTQFEVFEALAYLDGSVAWCTMIGASAIAWPAAFLPARAIDRVFAGRRIPTAAVAVQPTGVATVAPGGYQVTGRWSFVSGIQHAEWITAGVSVCRAGAPPRGHLMVVFPAAAAAIEDDWDAGGLEGTGSCSFAVRELFVPSAFTWDFLYGPQQRGGALYRLGWPGFVAHEAAAFALGVGRRALDAVVNIARSGRTALRPGPTKLADTPTFRWMVGDADIRLRAARALVIDVIRGAWTHALDAPLTPRHQADLHSAAAFATDVARDVAVRAFRAGGSAAVYRSSVLDRCVRDIFAAGQHWLARDSAHETLGCSLLEAPAGNDAAPSMAGKR